jgi:Tfp pilus assembly protein PilF
VSAAEAGTPHALLTAPGGSPTAREALAACVEPGADTARLARGVTLAEQAWSDALTAKGSLLLQLPRLLGGDAAEGERLLRAALARDPEMAAAHLELARGLARHGRRTEARTEAERAATLAERAHDTDLAERARKLLRELD